MTDYITSQHASYALWECSECDSLRHWGFYAPEPRSCRAPLLRCLHCRKNTRHTYIGVVHSREMNPNVDWGDYRNVRDGVKENHGTDQYHRPTVSQIVGRTDFFTPHGKVTKDE